MISIETEASIRASIDLITDNNDQKKWIELSFFNLIWNEGDKLLSLCGKNGRNAFESIVDSSLFSSHIMNIFPTEIIRYLKEGYSLILPISTEKLGISGKNFNHNIFVSSIIDENKVIVNDYWAPRFMWSGKEWDIQKVIGAIREDRSAKIFPLAVKYIQSGEGYDFDSAELLIGQYLEEKMFLGIKVYEHIRNWIDELDDIYHLNHVIFVVLEEHFLIWRSILSEINADNKMLNDLIMKSTMLRKLTMKYWYSKIINVNWKQRLKDMLTEIQVKEYELLNDVRRTK